jgi:hypothetical protein
MISFTERCLAIIFRLGNVLFWWVSLIWCGGKPLWIGARDKTAPQSKSTAYCQRPVVIVSPSLVGSIDVGRLICFLETLARQRLNKRSRHSFSSIYMEETTMKIRTIVTAIAFALSSTMGFASATTSHKHHRHYVGKMHHGMTIGMAVRPFRTRVGARCPRRIAPGRQRREQKASGMIRVM